jgi:hypothetical protein
MEMPVCIIRNGDVKVKTFIWSNSCFFHPFISNVKLAITQTTGPTTHIYVDSSSHSHIGHAPRGWHGYWRYSVYTIYP